MNQSTDIHQEENNDIVTPESLEGRANRIAQELYLENSDQTFSLIKSGSTELQQNFREKFPLDHDEINIVWQYIIYKISEDLFSRNVNTPVVCLCYIARCIIFLIEIYKDTNSDIFIDKFAGIFTSDTESNKVVLASLTCFIGFQYDLRKDQWENVLQDFGLQDFDRNLFGQLFGYIISTYCSYSPDYWVKKLTKLEDGYEKDILLSTPFIWTEEEFAKSAKPTQLKNHVRINGTQYKLDVKSRKAFERLHSPVPHWFARLCKNSYGKIEFDMIPDLMSKGVLGTFHINKSLLGSSSKMNEAMPLIFEDIIALPNPKFDEDKIVKILEGIRSFDTQKSLSDKAQPIVENVSQDVTTLIHRTFINPKQHHTDVAQSLGLDIVDHTDDIGATEGAMMLHPRYKNSHGTSNLHYLPKIAWLIDLLEDIIPKNEHGKITAYTLPSSPYVFIYTNTGTIFVSDIDNVSTQVFAQKVDPEFINPDFSFPALGALFGPFTSIKNTFEEVISDESAESWAQHILHALSKKEAHFPDLMSDAPCNWGTNLRALYRTGEITKKDFTTPADLKQFLENYNRKISLRNDITIQEKRTLSFVNSRGGVPALQPIINDLGGHSFFTSYHGHAKILSDYMDAVLSNKREQYDALYENLRSKNTVKASIRGWMNELKNGTKTLSDVQFQGLFSPDTHIKKSMRKELNVPFGLFTPVSWIITLGHDPEGLLEGETTEMYLARILIEEKILSHNQNT